MCLFKTLLASCLLLSSGAFAAEAAQATAAVLGNHQGTVLVNQGEEFVTAAQAQVLIAGDRVMVMEGGTAEITFADGCVLLLASGSMVVVPATSTCAGSVAAVEQIGPTYAQAVGAPRDERCADGGESNNDGNNDCSTAAYRPGSGEVVGNRGAGWVFGGWTAGIAWALIEGDYRIRSVSP